MSEQYRAISRTTDEIIQAAFLQPHLFLWSGVRANEILGYKFVDENADVQPTMRWRNDVVDSVLRRHAARGAFDYNGNHQRALGAVYEAYPQKGRTAGNDLMIINASADYRVPFLADDLIELISRPEVWSKLSDSPEFLVQRQANLAREREIAAMTKNGSSNFTIRTGNSNSVRYDTNGFELQYSSSGGTRRAGPGFEGMSDQEVYAMWSQWSDQQAMNKMSVEDLRKVVKTGVQAAFVEKTQRDPQSLQPIVTAADAAEPLIDFRDGSVIDSRRKLIAFINDHHENSKKLLVGPDGKVIQHRKIRFEQLLNSR
ncbi:MAG: hypothetical protein WBL50_16240 [Candidatus Acidiferrum sp.]